MGWTLALCPACVHYKQVAPRPIILLYRTLVGGNRLVGSGWGWMWGSCGGWGVWGIE